MPSLKYLPDAATAIVKAFECGLNVTLACRKARIQTQTYYRWLKEYPEFAEAVELAKRKAKAVVVP